jgi:hypothetical protein
MDIGEGTDVAVWNDGMIAVAFSGSNRSVVVVFDQNLNEMNQIALESSVSAWAGFEWNNGCNYLCVAMANRAVAIYRLAEMVEVWKHTELECDVSKVFVERTLGIVIGSTCGKIVQIPFVQTT